MVNHNDDYEVNYKDWQESIYEWYNLGSKIKTPKTLENSWLYDKTGMQYDEANRLSVLLPLIKLEVENKMLSDDLLEELEIYYDDFNDGMFNELFDEWELELIKEDLTYSYNNRMNSLYKKGD